jgi:2-phospho-L-lactate transferase/gluconeogenesis factor (CofD/UPF0052 family)
MMRALGLDPFAAAVAEHCRGRVTGFVGDAAKPALAPTVAAQDVTVTVAATAMRSAEDRLELARSCFACAREPGRDGRSA